MKIPNFGECHCANVEFGSYDNQVVMKHPSGKLVCIDTCIATEIGWLWHQGINTINSCCGHGKIAPSVIVDEKDYDKMDDLGYKFGIAPSGRRAYLLKTKEGEDMSKKQMADAMAEFSPQVTERMEKIFIGCVRTIAHQFDGDYLDIRVEVQDYRKFLDDMEKSLKRAEMFMEILDERGEE